MWSRVAMDTTLFLKPLPNVDSLCFVLADERVFQQLGIVRSFSHLLCKAIGRERWWAIVKCTVFWFS